MPPETDIIALALAEDIGWATSPRSISLIRKFAPQGRIVAREPCIVAGLDVAEEVFRRVDAESGDCRDVWRMAPA